MAPGGATSAATAPASKSGKQHPKWWTHPREAVAVLCLWLVAF
jgi:hypothetical protein